VVVVEVAGRFEAGAGLVEICLGKHFSGCCSAAMLQCCNNGKWAGAMMGMCNVDGVVLKWLSRLGRRAFEMKLPLGEMVR
jgi:hypothetical protein